MSSDFPSSLDNLAANGIVNFDSEAYIKGTAPRYVGNPPLMGLPFEQPLPAFPQGQVPQMHAQPNKDAFVHSEGHKNPSWKTALATVLAASAAVFVGVKYGSKIGSIFNKKKAATGQQAPTAAPTTATPPPATTQTTAASKVQRTVTKIKDVFTTFGTKIKALPRWAKITGGIAAGVIVFSGLKKLFSGHKAEHAQAGSEFPKIEQPRV